MRIICSWVSHDQNNLVIFYHRSAITSTISNGPETICLATSKNIMNGFVRGIEHKKRTFTMWRVQNMRRSNMPIRQIVADTH